VPGTDGAPQRAALIRDLTVAGWLLLGGTFGFLAFQLERVRSIAGDATFGAWDQRIEVLSFIMLPPNIVVLAPATAAAAVAVWLAGSERGPWLIWLIRLTAGIAIAMVVIGAVAIVNIYANDDGDIDGVFLRLGGMSMATGMAWLCRAADRA